MPPIFRASHMISMFTLVSVVALTPGCGGGDPAPTSSAGALSATAVQSMPIALAVSAPNVSGAVPASSPVSVGGLAGAAIVALPPVGTPGALSAEYSVSPIPRAAPLSNPTTNASAAATSGVTVESAPLAFVAQAEPIAVPAPGAFANSPDQQITAAAVSQKPSRLAVAISDMTQLHEVVPLGVGATIGWKYRPGVGMNTEPYGWAIPSYWKGIRYADWRAMVPWFVIYEGEPSNPAKNVQVEISGIEAWVLLNSTRKWQLLGAATKPVWDSFYAPNAIDLISTDSLAAVSPQSVSYTTGPSYMIHGGLGQMLTPWSGSASDIRAMYVSVRHRLKLKDASMPDDRAVANIGVQVGLDYYPWLGSKLSDMGASYVPGAGLGRFIKVSVSWRYSTVLLKNAGVSDAQLIDAGLPNFAY
jgi:hypothetical protein